MHRRELLARAAAGAALGALAPAEAAAPPAGLPPLPPTNLVDLDRTVRGVLAGKRVGSPVFVRLTLHGPARPGEVVPRLARLARLALGWLGKPLARLHATGSPASGQVCLTLQTASGTTALVTLARGRARCDGLDLMLLGNRGAVYSGPGWDGGLDLGAAAPDADLVRLIRRSLRTGKPAEGGAP